MSIQTKILGKFIIGLILGIAGLIFTGRLTNMSNNQYELQEASSGVMTVLYAHYTWRQDLTDAVLTMSPFTGSLDPNTCALSKWKNSDEARRINKIIKVIDDIAFMLEEMTARFRFRNDGTRCN